MTAVLEIRNITKKFNEFEAVKEVSFTVEEGSFFSILGPSGCGKTTLLRMISGFLEPTSGSLSIRGENVLGVPPNKRPVNLVFQNLALFPMMNVTENIAFGLKRQQKSKDEIDAKVTSILDRVGLSGYEEKEISQLSGGQKQRVAIARSLVLDPSILLLDEPLGALDLKLREQMKLELKKLQKEVGTTFIYITHDQSEALMMSDQVAVMNNGQIEQIDSPRNLYENPATSFVAGFVGENNRLRVEQIPGQQKNLVRTDQGLELHINDGDRIDDKPLLFIRPEAVILDTAGDTGELNILDIEVKNILFDGANTKILATAAGLTEEIAISLPQNSQFSHITVGDRLKAGVHPDHCRCYPAKAGENV